MMMITFRSTPLSLAFLLVCTTTSLAHAGDEVLSEQTKFFEAKVRPLLIDHCIRCHGDEKQEGGLRLDSQAAFMKGGESGHIVDPNSPDASLFLSAIHYKDLEMPPSGKLSDEKIQILEKWVYEGSNWPEKTASLSARQRRENGFSQEEKSYWFFQPTKTASLVPSVAVEDQVDSLVREALLHNGLDFSEPANAATLIRRVYLDLLGVTPSFREVSEFVADSSPDAYSSLVDRLLDDPRYGERWGRFWLDLVRFAESDGYKQDDFRPTAYRYRDYVIRSFNEDKPYSDFVREQLAGDEIDPDSLECRDASGYLRLWIYEYNQRDVTGQWTAILNDLTDVTGEAFLGLGYGCARCHDHKFDPLLQKDYYRLQAYFAGLIPREDLPAATPEQIERNLAIEKSWREAASPFLETIESLEAPVREKVVQSSISKFPPDVRPALSKPASERSTREKQIAHLAHLQQLRDVKEIKWDKALPADKHKEHQLAKEYLKQLPAPKPETLPIALTATDAGLEPAEVYVPGKNSLGPVSPGIPSILNPASMLISPLADRNSSGRRLALANWIVQPDNPLTWRVIVNRVWQQHFGRGIVSNASDFGKLTEPPTHPELLDLLATAFARDGGRFKSLHRWILHSRSYRQTAYPATAKAALQIDPDNRWLWRFSPRRLDAEQIRDSILSATGELRPMHDGSSVDGSKPIRSIFVRAMRNAPDRFLALFDSPDASTSTAKRNATTTPLQSLMMMNSDWINLRAENMAKQIVSLKSSPRASVEEAFSRVFLRSPTNPEVDLAMDFLGATTSTNTDSGKPESDIPQSEKPQSHQQDWRVLLVDYCHVLLNSNSFLHLE